MTLRAGMQGFGRGTRATGLFLSASHDKLELSVAHTIPEEDAGLAPPALGLMESSEAWEPLGRSS